MIPAALAAQFAKPLVKWGAIIGGGALLLLSVWLHGRSSMETKMEQQRDAEISKQAQESAAQVIAEAKMSNEVLKEQAENIREAVTAAAPVKQEVRRYEPAKPCSLDPEFARLFDAVSSLSSPREDRVSATDVSAGESPDTSRAIPETPEGLQHDQTVGVGAVLEAYYDAVEYAMFLWIDYSALVQWERGRFIVHQTQTEQEN